MTKRINSDSAHAVSALELVEGLQVRFVNALEQLGKVDFIKSEWLRDEGRHGGGVRYGVEDTSMLGRASVNVSQVQYDDDPSRKLGSATALSTIVHPASPRAPSVHIHISWTELKKGRGYWRVMADLNPALPDEEGTSRFAGALKGAGLDYYDEAAEQGDRYFFIPALSRHRGSTHFYLENFTSGSFAQDAAFAKEVGMVAVDTYVELLRARALNTDPVTDEDQAVQLAYHTLYLFQVLTLDRGTTAGLLVHDQNDIGILGSLPPRIDKNLLASWRSRMLTPQDKLLDGILNALPRTGVCTIDADIKTRLAAAVRAHYKQYPEALELQASGNSTPPTVDNHR